MGRLKTGIEQKKQEKRDRLKAAAYALFRKHGIEETAIDDIVQEGKVAKGTFYLYFKNKQEILAELVMEKSRDILVKTYGELSDIGPDPGPDALVAFIDLLIGRLARDRALLEIIHKNLNWAFLKRMVSASEKDEALKRLKESFQACLRASSGPERDAEKTLFIIIELASSISYSAIIEGVPAPMSEMRPLLLDSVRRIVS